MVGTREYRSEPLSYSKQLPADRATRTGASGYLIQSHVLSRASTGTQQGSRIDAQQGSRTGAAL